MDKNLFAEMMKVLHEEKPVVHSITNYVTVNDCANILLASGASPIMADEEEEMEEITGLSSAVNLNIGTLNKRTVRSMLKAGSVANEIGVPVILDPVGAGASQLRTETALNLISNLNISVIRGNMSEMRAVAKGSGSTKGVDVDLRDVVSEQNIDESVDFVKELSAKLGMVVAATGEIDLISDGNKTYIVRNGVEMLSQITGSGCMLSALTAALCASNKPNFLEAATASVLLMTLSGEKAYKKVVKMDGGHGLFSAYLIDEIGKAKDRDFAEGIKIELR